MEYVGTGSLDGEISRLRAENRALSEDLAQCQADKEFVWSLWKRLQVASPDITQAIGIVVQREKEKAEIKDRKVLSILSVKDDKIDELQKVIATQSAEVSGILSKKMELSENVGSILAENEELKKRLDQLQLKVDEFEKRTQELGEKEELSLRISKMSIDMESIKRDKTDLVAIKDSQKERIKRLEDELHEARDEYNKIAAENTHLRQNIQGQERIIKDMQLDFDHKDRELESIRKEMAETWDNHRQLTEHAGQQAHLIQQLRSLQTDTQKMLKNQEDAFSMESSSIYGLYSELKNKYASQLAVDRELKSQSIEFRKTIQKQEGIITDLQRKLDDSHNRSVSTQASLEDKEVQAYEPERQIEYRLRSMQTEIESLKDRLRHKESSPLRGADPPCLLASPLPSPRHSSTPGRSGTQHRRTPSSEPRRESRPRTKSCSPERTGDNNAYQRRMKHTERRLADCEAVLRLKCNELDEIRSAHDRRLERLKALQTNYRLCKKQLKTLEEELNGPVRKKKKPKRVTDPKALQKEDSDAVWNELAYFKTEHKNLVVERMNLQEELDTFKVQVAQDAATIHELRTCLEQEKEELAFLLEQQRSASPEPDAEVMLEAAQAEVSSAREAASSKQRQIDDLRTRLEKSEVEKNKALKERDGLYEEKRAIRGEINSLRQEVADRRMDITDLKRDLLRAQRELRKKKKKEKVKPPVAKQYQKVLNRSIQTMSHMFEDFDKDGWEEISETSFNDDTGLTDITATTDSLGTRIVRRARENSPDRDRQKEAEADHIKRFVKHNDSPVRGTIIRRDVALSPITVPGVRLHSEPHAAPHVVSKKSAPSPSSRQLSSLRQRITSLQKEVNVLREAKNTALKRESELRRNFDVVQSDLQLANQRLASSRSTSQRLNTEVDRLKAAKEDLETQIDTATVDTSGSNFCTEQEYHSLQSRLKNSTSELSKQLSQIKELKEENASHSEKVKTLQTKVSHVERDLSQKRTLVEDLRYRLKVAQENAKTDTEVMSEAEEKIKQLADTNSRYKTQMDSNKQRIAAVAREKHENEDKVIKLSQELDKKTKLVTDLQKKNRELDSALSQLEKTAENQLVRLAEQSELAMETAQTQLKISTAKLQEYNKFVKLLAHAVINSLQQARSLTRQHEKKKKEASQPKQHLVPSMEKAQRVAADILHLNQSDLDDIMSVTDSPRVKDPDEDLKDSESKKDRKWQKKWEKVLSTKNEFGMPLVELFMDKLEERCQLAASLSTL